MSRQPFSFILVVCCTFLISQTLVAQTTSATISGRVADQTNAVVAGAKVSAQNVATGVSYSTETNDVGFYNVPNLPPGKYRVFVSKEGFARIVKPDVQLHLQDEVGLNFALQVGSVDQTITVKGGAPLVNTEDASVSTVVDRQFVSNLPLSGRSFQSLILLTPGVVPAAIIATDAPGEFNINGQRQNTNYFTLDGVSANTGVSASDNGGAAENFGQQAGGAIPGTTALGTTAGLVSIDALQEFRIQTSTYSAEFGRQPGGQIQLVTRSGANQFHGSLFEYLRNDAMDAQDWFNASTKAQYEQAGLIWRRPALRQNQFGGTVSGPIVKNKTFFFFSYEGQRLRVPVTQSAAEAVPAKWLRDAAAPSLQPYLNAFPLPTGAEIQTLEHPLDPYDPVNNPYVPSGFAYFATGYSNPSSVDAYSIRVDHTVNDKIRLFGRYADTPSNSLIRDLNQLTGSVMHSRVLTVGATWAVSPRINNEFRFNYTGSEGKNSEMMDNFGGATPLTVSQLDSPYSGPQPMIGTFSVQFFAEGSFFQLGDVIANTQRQFNIVDNLSWVKGRHQLTVGADWRHLTPTYGLFAYYPFIYAGTLSFPPDYSDYLSRIESGIVNVYIHSNKGGKFIYDNVSAYAQDSWKATPRLTLDYGVRWEVNPPPHSASGRHPLMLTGVHGTDVSNAALARYGTAPYKTIYSAFAPRVGVAYQLKQRSGWETVLRGGLGVFYDLGSNMAVAGADQYPFFSQTALYDVTLPLTSAQAQQPAFPDPTQITLPITQSGIFAFNPDLKLPLSLQWSVALEQALGSQQAITLSYVASAGRRLTITQDLNGIPSDAIQYGSDPNQYRPNPNFLDIYYTRNAPTSDYQSLQVQYRHNLSRGLQALVGYTWSHAIDQASYDFDQFTTLSRSNAAFDIRHNLSAAFTYNFPRLSNTRALVAPVGNMARAIVNGWSVDSIITARTGLPLDVNWSGVILPNGQNVTIRPDLVAGQPLWTHDSTVPGSERLNVNAFASPPFTVVYPYPNICPTCPVDVYQQGNLARNSVRLPGIYQINMGVRRQFSVGERWKVEAKIEAFNVLNHPLFGNYDNGDFPGNPTFGEARAMLSTAAGLGAGLNSLYQNGGPRSIQISLRASF